jgi:hypothetical protein
VNNSAFTIAGDRVDKMANDIRSFTFHSVTWAGEITPEAKVQQASENRLISLGLFAGTGGASP